MNRPATGVTGVAPTVAMSFTYDEAGNRTGATWSGATVGWRYDGLNRVTGVDFGAEAVTRHSYDLLGRRTATTRGAASSAYGYDIAGQLKNLSHAWSGGSLAASYGYDDAGGLINEALDNSAFLWQPAPTLTKTTAYDPASPINALTRVDGVTQTHDDRGNRTGAAGRTWRYDTRNMLVGANAPGMAATYGYYPEGGRAWKQVNGVTTLYLELDGIEWGNYDPTGTLKERTIRASGAGGAVVAIHSPTGGLIRLLPNRQGSVIGWLRPDGKLGGAYTYDAYGNSPQAGAAGPQFRYAGMRFDAETGLYHTPNRAYDPQDGRWMQLDPIGIKDGLNQYAYVKDSPLMGVDPTGLISAGQCAQLETCRKGKSNSELGGMLKKDQESGQLKGSLNDVVTALGKGTALGVVSAGAHKAAPGEQIPTDAQETQAGDEGDRQTYYGSRALRGDAYGITALQVTWNYGFLGKIANGNLAGHLNMTGRTPAQRMAIMRSIARDLIGANIEAVAEDIAAQQGLIFGSLSAVQITNYHHRVFERHGVRRDVFGGTFLTGLEAEAKITAWIWCGGCDAP
ncbi:RHS repeat-associated core domain-containing protein [Asticcacaulis sp.]|uniref:RHS repeat-associated core domain-containing protein n=1 Tax=Asticcacaulis sp. TaxID=1872648 RepID=UPI00260C9FBD|nr:RHS repeat-associated core domain-containing protein [Asticcacaulis sp.]